METDAEVKETFTAWLNGLEAEFYDEGIVKLLSRLDECLNLYGDYVEK
jgi:hypothetical protein